MKKTKQEIINDLIAEKEQLKKQAAIWENKVAIDSMAQNRIKKEFAKCFGWMQQKNYSVENEPKLPSWEEIFVEVGRILAIKNYHDVSENLHMVIDRVGKIEYKLSQKDVQND